MGVVNVTPDSFWAGSRRIDPGAAIAHGRSQVEAGAQILDIGGESTRPGHEPVPAAEQIRRVAPVLEGLAATGVPLSIDTTRADVATAALDAGASWINDTSALTADPALGRVAAERGCPLVLMHQWRPERPLDAPADPAALIDGLCDGLQRAVDRALAAGCALDQIILDPGLGFGLSHEDNAAVVANLDSFRRFGAPLLVGPSRKRFVGHFTGQPVEERLMGTAAVVAALVLSACDIVRVHDVAAMRDVVAMSDAIRQGREVARVR